ncbi:rab effector MyRIP isoform X2 [Brachyhypopomus gauderio]|uniref:rab effector MyRIP isoform X2 n=1 Tax=Brachyhypopomus gauderio TaxID=698409 RepID=UPI004042000C
MGRKLDLSGLTDGEAEHVLRVVQRDMKLRKKEEERLSELKQELVEEESRCLLLAGSRCFTQQCCIRCCRPFGFLLHPRRDCLDCRYAVCSACCSYSQQQGGYVCAVCQRSRFLRTQSLEWYYNNVKSRFKRFGSAKVLKTLYKKHIIERVALSELPEGSVPEGSNENDGSDCALYRQSEGHSMADTLTVALRVAEEAIEEAICKADSYRDSLEKQNEARYLRDHREELVEELATTIVQKIIHRGKRSEMQAEYDFVWSQAQNPGMPSAIPTSTTHTLTQDAHTPSQHGNLTQACLKNTYSLWRAQSAFSPMSDESPEKAQEAEETAEGVGPGEEPQLYSSLRRESRASVPGWKSVDRLDNSSASSVLQSPDGNWLALQTSQHSRPGLLTKRKSLVFSVLEKESGVVSAYDGMGSDDSEAGEQGDWGVALLRFRRHLSDETYYTDPQRDPDWTCARLRPPVTSPSSGQYTNTETLNSDSEASAEPPGRACEPARNYPRGRKEQVEPNPLYAPYLPPRHLPAVTVTSNTLDVNFNPRVGGDSSEGEEQSEQIRRCRRRRRSKRELAECNRTRSTLYSAATAENSALLLNAMMLRRQQSQETQSHLIYQTPDTVTPPYLLTSGAMTPDPDYQDTIAPNSMATSPPTQWKAGSCKGGPNTQAFKLGSPSGNDGLEQELRSKLSELVGQISREDMTSSEDEPIRKVGKRREEEEREKEGEQSSQKERKSEREMETSKRTSERWMERQVCQERDPNNTARQVEKDRKDERARERQEKNSEMHREIKAQVSREMEIQRERRVKREQVRRAEKDGEKQSETAGRAAVAERDERTVSRVNGPSGGANTSEVDAQKAAADGGRRKGSEEEDGETEDEGTVARRVQMRRSQSERGPDKRAEDVELKRTRSAFALADSAPCRPEEQASPTEKYSAASLCSITTEVLKVLNATEELIGEAEGKGHDLSESMAGTPLSSGPDSKRLDQHLTKMEENVYLTAGAVYTLEGALGELEDCARSINGSTTETELAFLEDQVATAAAQVQQSELQISNIEARISALKNAGLNVSTCSRFSKYKLNPKPQTLDSSRQQRRKLPAPPATEKECSPEQARSPQP